LSTRMVLPTTVRSRMRVLSVLCAWVIMKTRSTHLITLATGSIRYPGCSPSAWVVQSLIDILTSPYGMGSALPVLPR
jgi:hypothetical protein